MSILDENKDVDIEKYSKTEEVRDFEVESLDTQAEAR